MSLLHRLQTPNVATLHVSKGISYNTTYAFFEFLAAMNSVVLEKIQKDIENSEVLTVLTDESTDRTYTFNKTCNT